MEKNLMLKNGILVFVLLVAILLSIFVISPKASLPESHSKAIESLDDKKMTVVELTAATAVGSTALAAIPGDATTPLANQIAKLSSYLLIVMGAIFLEKILLTLTGYVSFTFIIPIACILLGIYLFVKKDVLKNLGFKLLAFGLIIFLVIPVSIKVSDMIETTFQSSINQTIEDAKNIEETTEDTSTEEKAEESGIFDEFSSKVKDTISNIGDTASSWLEKGKQTLSNLMDAIAVLIITSCVIPIIVLFLFVWLVKIIFGINVPILKSKKQD